MLKGIYFIKIADDELHGPGLAGVKIYLKDEVLLDEVEVFFVLFWEA
jgi:hypothetical protein